MSKARPKIGILAFWFPPLQAPGSLRSRAFFEQAAENGFDAFALTVEPGGRATPPAVGEYAPPAGMRVYRFPGFDLGCWLSGGGKPLATSPSSTASPAPSRWKAALRSAAYAAYRNLLCFPDQHLPWYWQARERIAVVIAKEQPDVLLVSAHPVTAFLIAAWLKRRFPELPWVADYRDPWSTHSWYRRPWPLSWLERRLERRSVGTAAGIITTSAEFQRDLQGLFPDHPTEVIYNGYDREDLGPGLAVPAAKFTICHAGLLYSQRSPALLFQAVRRLLDAGELREEELEIAFYGKVAPELPGWVAAHRLEPVVVLHGTVPRRQMLERERQCNLLLLIQSGDGAIPSKLFEYLSARVPILGLVDRQREIAAILCETGGGVACENVDEVLAELRPRLAAWRQGGMNAPAAALPALDTYDRRTQNRQLYQWLCQAILRPS